MSISVNDHKVLRALFTNFYSAQEEGACISLDRVESCTEPCGLENRSIVASINTLQRKKFVVISNAGSVWEVIWTRKGIRKAESLGPCYDER